MCWHLYFILCVLLLPARRCGIARSLDHAVPHIELTPVAKPDKLEVFQPLDHNYKWKEVVELDNEQYPPQASEGKKFSIYFSLSKHLVKKKLNNPIGELARQISRNASRINASHKDSICLKNKLAKATKMVKITLETLRDDTLSKRERLYALCTLKYLHHHIQRHNGNPIRMDMRYGAISRGALELNLTKGFDIQKTVQEMWCGSLTSSELNPALLEALERADVVLRLREYALSAKHAPLSQYYIIYMHDALLTAPAPLGEQSVDCFVSTFFGRISIGNFQDLDSHVTNYFFRTVKKYLSCEHCKETLERALLWNPSTPHRSENAKILIQTDVNLFFSRSKVDPFFQKLLSPFTNLDKVNLSHYEQAFAAINADQLEHGQSGREFGLRNLTAWEYLNQQNFLITILLRAAHEIKVNTGIEFKAARPTTESSTESEQESCPICLEEYIEGKRVIQLNCDPKNKHSFLIHNFSE
ncbi:hypothetical protein CROQUDRAFT_131866 [Cronartium quercuum f. sp. fusiforme G11]|uniref:Thiol oxidase n=1 Tax=Cronartium quercuum f. sp. fusiforme G11 TaxID=708437 RepID=A0A9P6NK38_9BASI|nr:hypothetical protein CROQUDRAFT_131866 [Cronartium quercuum f. sp. fusiforme G11]